MDKSFDWRHEVASRVDRYRVRKKQLPRERSLRLDFGQSETVTSQQGSRKRSGRRVPAALRNLPPEEISFLATSEELPAHAVALEEPAPALVRPAEDNVIEFPRSALCPTTLDELAEPVPARPRILDVPEELQLPLTPLEDLGLESPPEPVSSLQPEMEVPLAIAPMGRRAVSAALDGATVLIASVIFVAATLHFGGKVPLTKLTLGLLLLLPCLLWSAYHYVFLVWAGRTPGMQAARLRLACFDGQPVSRRRRKGRALGAVLSCLPLALGVAWAFFDEDSLCWHDRVSRTYLTLQRLDLAD